MFFRKTDILNYDHLCIIGEVHFLLFECLKFVQDTSKSKITCCCFQSSKSWFSSNAVTSKCPYQKWWTLSELMLHIKPGCRTEPEPEKFYFSEPEPNLNPQTCAQVNPNQTWTPNKSKNIFFHIRMPLALVHARTIRAVVIIKRISNFYFFFSGQNE